MTGCGSGDPARDPSARDLLDRANAAMRRLDSVRIEYTTTTERGGTITSRQVTDLSGRCVTTITWSQGGRLEQIRIGETDYVRPDRAYLQRWKKDGSATAEQRLWVRTPVTEASAAEGLGDCPREFRSFGTVTKGETTRVGGRAARELHVVDGEPGAGTYVFSVATEGTPYVLKVVYRDDVYDTTTTFGDFDASLDIRPPKDAEVVDGDDVRG
ncbi:hypothetical protein [Streptomyces tagetis]|uniref:hypothetical protein n=1 Tax=Streptomyces tagetis TaxID=2820809 RepID=UPI0027DE2704|nr:hypothetical protein [Streptomyces sp. RG38]